MVEIIRPRPLCAPNNQIIGRLSVRNCYRNIGFVCVLKWLAPSDEPNLVAMAWETVIDRTNKRRADFALWHNHKRPIVFGVTL